MDDNLDNLFEDALNGDATQPTDAPAGEAAPAEGSDTGAKENAPEPPAPSEEDKRNRNAERRIRREQRIADEARNAERTRTNELLKRLGIERPDGGTIDSVEDLEEYDRNQTDERVPGGKAAAEAMRRIIRQTMSERSQQDETGEVDRQLAMIRELDPSMEDLGTILGSDIGETFRREVDGGATFLQAYGRAVREKNARIAGTSAASAAKQAGKGHLAGTSTRGEGALTVPADEMRIIRECNPGVTDAEIQRYYNADKKRIGR